MGGIITWPLDELIHSTQSAKHIRLNEQYIKHAEVYQFSRVWKKSQSLIIMKSICSCTACKIFSSLCRKHPADIWHSWKRFKGITSFQRMTVKLHLIYVQCEKTQMDFNQSSLVKLYVVKGANVNESKFQSKWESCKMATGKRSEYKQITPSSWSPSLFYISLVLWVKTDYFRLK